MPTKIRPVGVKSVPVKVSLDELSTEMLRRFPEEAITDALISASLATDKRLRDNRRGRHDQYHAKLFFRRIAQRLPNPTDDLAVAVGMKDADKLKTKALTDAFVDLAKAVATAVEEAEPDIVEAEPEPEPEPVDDFANMLDIPTFADYAAVFEKYPYVRLFQDEKRNEKLLALGYASGRDSDDDLIIRNCVFVPPGEPAGAKGTSFNDLVSVVGVLRKTNKGVRQFIKVIPYRVGGKVRTWHHVRDGGGDKAEWNRHFILTEKEGLQKVGTRSEWNAHTVS